MAAMEDILALCGDLELRLSETETEKERKGLIEEHLHRIDSKCTLTVPDFPEGSQWINSKTLSISKHLKGKLVILDFFTYCCINCIHVLPDLVALEKEHSIEDGVVVIGVHSAKFGNEKVLENIRSAVFRHNIHHPVVNDHEAHLWQELQIRCWPTFLLVGPQNQYVYSFSGEGHRRNLLEFVSVALEYYRNQGHIGAHALPVCLESNRTEETFVKFPGKVGICEDVCRLAIADTGNNRIIVTDYNGIVQLCIGGKGGGFKDGPCQEAEFSSPQGVVMEGTDLYVADTGNHCIRKIDLKNKEVTTLTGTGVQGLDKEGGHVGRDQEISSPWDLALGSSLGSSEKDVLFIAMAGIHQIWAYFLKDGTWYKGRKYITGTCVRVAGSGNEENRNNSYPEKASFAQPSGLALSPRSHLNCLFVADSESSSIRVLLLKNGAVKGLVGAEQDPTNLFAFGDKAGAGVEAKLQHPLGVALLTKDCGPLLVADTYNHKIKTVDLETKTCTTLLGSGTAGNQLNHDPLKVRLNEPGGLAVNHQQHLVYIADTNNHGIKVFNIKTKELSQLPIVFPSSEDSLRAAQNSVKLSRITPKRTPKTMLPIAVVAPEGKVSLTLVLDFPNSLKLSENAKSLWQIFSEDYLGMKLVESLPCNKGILVDLKDQPSLSFEIPSHRASFCICLECVLYVCEAAGMCRMLSCLYEQQIKIEGQKTEQKDILITWKGE